MTISNANSYNSNQQFKVYKGDTALTGVYELNNDMLSVSDSNFPSGSVYNLHVKAIISGVESTPSNDITLNTLVTPQLVSNVVKLGNNYKINVQNTGEYNSSQKFKVYVGGSALQGSYELSNGGLLVPTSEFSENQTYKVSATASFENYESNISNVISIKPFNTPIIDGGYISASSVKLSVSSSTVISSAKYKWYVDGDEKAEGQSYTYTFQPGDIKTHEFYVIAESGGISEQSQTKQFVSLVPNITVTQQEDANYRLNLKINNPNSSYTYQWEEITPSGKVKQINTPSYDFNYSLSPDDLIGKYAFYVKSSGEYSSESSKSTIYAGKLVKPKISVSKTSEQPAVGKGIEYNLKVTNSNSNYSYEWYSNSERIGSGTEFKYIIHDDKEYNIYAKATYIPSTITGTGTGTGQTILSDNYLLDLTIHVGDIGQRQLPNIGPKLFQIEITPSTGGSGHFGYKWSLSDGKVSPSLPDGITEDLELSVVLLSDEASGNVEAVDTQTGATATYDGFDLG